MEKELSVIMPVNDEAEIIEEVVTNFYKKIIKKLPNSELIVTEDGSTDGTREILKALNKKINFKLIATPEKKGYFKATKEALKLAKGRFVLFSDSDNTHDPDDFWKMYKSINKCDIVLGYRINRQDPIFRKMVTKIHNSLMNLLFLTNYPDINCSFRLIRREVMENVLDDVKVMRYSISTEFIIRSRKKGYRILTMPVKHFQRKTGKTFISSPKKLLSVAMKYFIDTLKLRIELI